ncbi:uncharacterized protein MONOS_12546 [Monocercomonoides exilis]|uniref:uncharacterized protein n=1 Tax=Monocercomonoides exilis TaxID=2049356 RepID=UPI00355A12FA|nr:hypothetical protein MONOS_12546 [Monocercomonoides exilis]|eukprot:MONOS_12546.1-p1 / transcript=MONOS_12546.1 / gene=MONOS_12546 / organism=Monocercomonoides_exilis_PA203 / gene_product=unspecified product / transcript_product=unspecified product / location=Mono_scaffold00701:2839-4029(+) / protein_length=397 / sequence_SO=supercontig / SO=protein_coding / is_pseudo=false
MLRFRSDALWSKRRAQCFYEDNETDGVIYQRKVESEASDIPGRHSPHASRQGCIEIDHTRNNPDLEESGMDTFRREFEFVINKECVVPVIALELGKDGSEAPREEESALAEGCAYLDSTCKERDESQNKRLSSTPREAEFCETATPTSKLADDAYSIRAETDNRPRGMEGDGNSQPNDTGRINTLEKDTTRKQTKESEEKEQTCGTNDERFRAGMGCSINNTEGEQRGEDICPRELDPPGECVSDKRKGVQSSVENFRKEMSMAETTEDRPYSLDDRQYVHEMNNTEEEESAIAYSNTESTREETEQPGLDKTNRISPRRTEYGSRCIQPDGEKAGLCTEGGKSLRDIADSRTENTRYNFRTDYAGALWNYLETILSEKVERVIELLLNKIVPVCY